MSKELKRIEEATRLITAGFAVLLGVDASSVAEAVAGQKSNTKVRETGTDDDEEPAEPKKKRGRPAKAKPPVEDDDEDEAPAKKKPVPPSDDDDDEDEPKASTKIPNDAALKELDRTGLKKIAVALGIDPAGKNYEDLLALLKEARDGKGKKSSKAAAAADDDDDDDEDEDEAEEAPKKKSKKEPAGPDEDDYPSLKVQKRDLEAFFKLNKALLTDMGFFGGKAKKGVTKVEHTYDEVMGDSDLIKEAWADNIWEHVEAGTWDKMKAKAADIEDDD